MNHTHCNLCCQLTRLGLVQIGALLIALLIVFSNEASVANCEAKEFDWGDLGVSLANAKSSLGGSGSGSGSSASNLRILVSPQRRMAKNYEFDYNSNSTGQSSLSSNTGDSTGYVVSSSSPYLAQSVYQLSPNHSGHSSAYSALSASLATLKNRLNARGVTLTSAGGGGSSSSSSNNNNNIGGASIIDVGSQPASSHLYSTSNSSYGGSAVILDPVLQQAQQQLQLQQQQQQQQQQPLSQLVNQHQQQQPQPQPTYLSVPAANHQDPSQSLGAYTVSPSQSSESNKTIVLAIPAKINFLTGGSGGVSASGGGGISKQLLSHQQQHHQQQQQQQQLLPVSQQAQQLSILQTSGLINNGGQEGAIIEQPGGQSIVSTGEPQEHHQYVFVNQAQQLASDHHSHSVAAGLSPSSVGAANGQTVYSTAIYQPATGQAGASYTMKYVPATYTTHQQVVGPVPSVQKIYSLVETSPQQQQQQQQLATLQGQQQQHYQTLPMATQYETQSVVQPDHALPQAQPPTTSSASRPYAAAAAACLETCNSSDPRWRKYTVNKYKSCCSRSSQYDTTFDQPSAEKVGEYSSRYTEDAYYNYLNRKSRARRSRRHRNRNSQNNRDRFYNQYASGQQMQAQQQQAGQQDEETTDPTLIENTRTNSARNQYYPDSHGPQQASKLSSYYKSSSRAYSTLAAANSAIDSGASVDLAPLRGDEYGAQGAGGGGGGLSSVAAGKYSNGSNKEARSYRRARARDYAESTLANGPGLESASGAQSNAAAQDNIEDDSVYPRESPGGAAPYAPSGSPSSHSSYGSGDYSVDLQGRGYGQDAPRATSGYANLDDDEQARFDETSGSASDSGKSIANTGESSLSQSDYVNGDGAEFGDDSEAESLQGSSYSATRYSSNNAAGPSTRRKSTKYGGAPKSAARRKQQQQAKESQKSPSYYKKTGGNRKNNNKSKAFASFEHQHSSVNNGSDYESAQPSAGASSNGGESSYLKDSQANSANEQSEDHTTYPSKESGANYESTEGEKDGSLSKYRTSLNETAVANLSKTTAHLKEILSILEKKANQGAGGNVRWNDSVPINSTAQQLPATSTPAPITTTTGYSLSSLLSGSPYSSSLTSDFLPSDFSTVLKSPYRFDPTSSFPSASSSLSSSPFSFGAESLSLPQPPPSYPSSYASLQAVANKHIGPPAGLNVGIHAGNPQRKRRPSKNSRYNELMFQKAAAAHAGLVTPTSLLHAKNRLLNPANYYSTLAYPYLFRANSPSITNPYPYKSHLNHHNSHHNHHHKNPYSSLLGGSVSSKLAAAAAASSGTTGNLYTDESRLSHGLSSLDPLSNMGSSLRPSATSLRLRAKPFMFQPQVLPIYARHTILAPSALDVVKA